MIGSLTEFLSQLRLSQHFPLAREFPALYKTFPSIFSRNGKRPVGLFVKRGSCLLLATFAALGMWGCTDSVGSYHKTDPYLYEDTRQLVDFVEGAAALIEQRGALAFNEFSRAGSRWRT